MLLSDAVEALEAARSLSMQAREPVIHYEHRKIGYNYRMSNVLAALGRSQLADLARRIRIRKAHFEAYKQELDTLPGVEFMPIVEPDAVNYWLTCLTIDSSESKADAASAIKALEAADIEARPLWKPLHLQPVFQECRYYGSGIEEKLFFDGLCLPSGTSLTKDERQKVITKVRSSLE